MVKVTEIAQKNGFDVKDFEDFVKNSGVKIVTGFRGGVLIYEFDEDTVVNSYRQLTANGVKRNPELLQLKEEIDKYKMDNPKCLNLLDVMDACFKFILIEL